MFWKSCHRINNNNQSIINSSSGPGNNDQNKHPQSGSSDNTATPIPQKSSNSQPANPATCNIGGSINFSSPTAAGDSAKLIYSGINSSAGQIYWTIIPNEKGLQIGPNLTASLRLPDGESQVQVVLPQNPKSKTYSLKAAMTYSRETNGLAEVYTANCSGAITVNRNY